MKITREFGRIQNAAIDFGYSVSDAFKGLFAKDPVAHAYEVSARAEALEDQRAVLADIAKDISKAREGTYATIKETNAGGRFVKGFVNIVAKPALWVVEQPIALAMKPVHWTLNGGTKLFTKFPKAAPVGLVLGAAAAGGTWFANRQSKNLQAQGDAIAQMQMAQAMPQGMYMNNPEASQAFVDARIAADRANGAGPASQVDSLTARQPAPDMATANISAL